MKPMINRVLTSSVAGQKVAVPSPVTIPDSFRGADTTASVAQTSVGDLKWFDVFRDEELQMLVRTALVHNYDLHAAIARINAARANLGLARSEQFPQFEASAVVNTSRNSKNGVPVPAGQGGRTRSF